MDLFLKFLTAFGENNDSLHEFKNFHLIYSLPAAPLSLSYTWVALKIFDVRIRAIVNTGAPPTIAST